MTRNLFDADRSSPAARARTSVADADAAFRAELVAEYVAACRSGADEFAELRLLAAARRFDVAHPSEPSLFEELHATQLRRAA